MVALYKQGKAGRIEPVLLGRLVHLLNSLACITRDVEFEQRLQRLEEAAETDPDWPRPGSGVGGRYATH